MPSHELQRSHRHLEFHAPILQLGCDEGVHHRIASVIISQIILVFDSYFAVAFLPHIRIVVLLIDFQHSRVCKLSVTISLVARRLVIATPILLLHYLYLVLYLIDHTLDFGAFRLLGIAWPRRAHLTPLNTTLAV